MLLSIENWIASIFVIVETHLYNNNIYEQILLPFYLKILNTAYIQPYICIYIYVRIYYILIESFCIFLSFFTILQLVNSFSFPLFFHKKTSISNMNWTLCTFIHMLWIWIYEYAWTNNMSLTCLKHLKTMLKIKCFCNKFHEISSVFFSFY